ncbi:MAG: helix-turn-helix domain-containing protein [Lachnospiraceae bacterium]|nr:helix-turn-helix domain-containing protein [Lachnospiraceae bacterium]
MSTQNTNTEAAILEAGKKEFLAYGYEKASLRRIAGAASVTTGAIYGYFPGKEALFEALTGAVREEMVELYRQSHQEFAQLPPRLQPDALITITDESIPWMVNYIYDHFDTFKLLLCCNAPGASERFFDQLAEIEEQSCWDLVNAMESIGHPVPKLNDALIHILCRSFFQQIQEFVSHDVSREEAVACALTLARFQHAGWRHILKMDQIKNGEQQNKQKHKSEVK